ncbi:MAG: hypothetical protein RMI79_06285 [Nitrososphaerota archaeon]|nr:hypothetical protein [Nitrososphaerota archaeon]
MKTGHGYWKIGTARKEGDRWRIDGIAEKADIYILVDVSGNDLQKFQFYIIPTKELKRIVETMLPQSMETLLKTSHAGSTEPFPLIKKRGKRLKNISIGRYLTRLQSKR